MINTVASNYDIIFFGIIALSTFAALFRGAVTEILSLVVWISSFWFMRNYGVIISAHLPASIPDNMLLRNVIVFIIVFIVTAIASKIVKAIMSSMVKGLGLSGLNYTLGILFGALRGVFICSALIIVIAMFRLDPNNAYQDSKAYPFLKPCIGWMTSSIPQTVSM